MKHPGLMRLGADIAQELERDVAERMARMDGERVSGPVPKASLDPRRLRGERSRALLIAAPAVAFAVAAAFALGFSFPHGAPAEPAGKSIESANAFTYTATGPEGARLSPTLGDPVSVSGDAAVLAFSDGSRVSFEPRTEARVVKTTPRGATVLLTRGRLAASVVHRVDTEWSFDAGPYVVHVRGTAFDLAWDPRREALTLHMTEGVVDVRGCGASRTVRAGEDLALACNEGVSAPSPVPSAADTATPSGVRVTPPPRGPSTPSVFAPHGEAPLAESGPPDASSPPEPSETMSADALWGSAETSRAAGDAVNAKASLLIFRRRFKGDVRAGTAAFLLGTLAYDAEHAGAEGLGWFSIYLAENPNGPLAREALGRALEAEVALDRPDDAKRLARGYLDAYHGGPHTDLATRVLGGKP